MAANVRPPSYSETCVQCLFTATTTPHNFNTFVLTDLLLSYVITQKPVWNIRMFFLHFSTSSPIQFQYSDIHIHCLSSWLIYYAAKRCCNLYYLCNLLRYQIIKKRTTSDYKNHFCMAMQRAKDCKFRCKSSHIVFK